MTRPITLDNETIQVTENLWNALSAISQHHNHGKDFWIDAICINQKDLAERNQQVQKMGTIYSYASMVYAWLGSEDSETRVAFETMDHTARLCDLDAAGVCATHKLRAEHRELLPLDQSAVDVVHSILSRVYFSRAWIVQEFIRAQDVLMLCGRCSCDWKLLYHFDSVAVLNFIWDDNAMKNAVDLLEGRVISQTAKSIPNRGNLSLWARVIASFKLLARAQCSDKHDHVFSILGHPWMESVSVAPITVDYALGLDEILMITLVWFEEVRLKDDTTENDALGRDEKRLSEYLWQYLARALCYETAWDTTRWNAKPLMTWLRERTSWDLTGLPVSITLASGRRVECSGTVLTFLLSLDEESCDHLLL